MRLHNRLLKAGFWTDEQVTSWPLNKRLFYIGLIQLADDSGCLEYSPRMIKRLLFPEEMSTEEVASLLAELIASGQLVSYDADGKRCLYIRHFHDHQSLDSPARPEVPLPHWITYEPYPSNKRQGRYVINDAALEGYARANDTSNGDVEDDPLHHPYTILTPTLQYPSNQNQNQNIEPETEPEEEGEGETKLSGVNAASATGPPEKCDGRLKRHEYSPGQRLFLQSFGRKRFANGKQAEAVRELENTVGYAVLERGVTWMCKKGLPSDVNALERACATIISNQATAKTRAAHSPPNLQKDFELIDDVCRRVERGESYFGDAGD